MENTNLLQALKCLPLSIRDKAVSNAKAQRQQDWQTVGKNYHALSLSEILIRSFSWADTPEGPTFWAEAYEALQEAEDRQKAVADYVDALKN